MKKTKLLWILCTIVLLLVGCPTEQSDSKSDDSQTSPSSGTGNPTKITGFANLQEVIDNDDTKAGAVIDLSDYANIEGFSYSAKIDKAVILQNTKNTALKGAALTVVTDGVVMSGIKNASVSTNSSLKISSSTLSSLSIVNTASSSPSSNQVSGRGDTSAAAVSKPPIVEVDHTEVAEDVSVAIENAYLNVENFTAKKAVSLDAANVQLTINDNTDTNIKQITTDQICQVVLVAGTSDTIPTPNVTGDGELKQINVAAAGNMELLALTPMSGLTSIVKQGESIDFSTVVVLGTYQANDGITIFKAGLSYELKETFSKLEKNYIVKIGSAKVFENGNNLSYNWAGLEAGTYNAEIDIDYSYPAETYQSYKFKIAVIGKTESQTEIIIPTFSLTELKAEKGGARTDYIAGDKLNLAGLMVFGTYTATVGDVTYSSIVTDYTLNPPNGTVLTADITSVTVESEGKTVSVPINVRALVNVTFIMDASNDIKAVQKLAAGDKVSMPNDPSRRGYIFSGWYKTIDNVLSDTTFDFNDSISADTILTAKWEAGDSLYTVKRYFQKLSPTTEYEQDQTNYPDLSLTGKTDAYTDVTADIIPGFTAQPITQNKISDDGSTVIEVKYNRNTITYTFDVNDAKGGRWTDNTEGNKTVSGLYGSHVYDVPTNNEVYNPDNTKEFGGWSYDIPETFGPVDMTFTALWGAPINIRYESCISQITPPENIDATQLPSSHRKGRVTSLPNLIGADHLFCGWYYDPIGEDGPITEIAADKEFGDTPSISIYAKWDYIHHILTYHLNNGTADITADIIQGESNNQVMAFNMLDHSSKIGYTFKGWNDSTGNPVLTGIMSGDMGGNLPEYMTRSDVDLYAQWQENKYTIEFSMNGPAEGPTMESQRNIGYDTLVQLPKNQWTREGYLFAGWSRDSSATEAEFQDEAVVSKLSAYVNGQVTLYAVWINANGNFIINGSIYQRTSLQTVFSSSREITCNQSEGMFKSGRYPVTIPAYAIGKYEVTQQLYQAVMGDNPSEFKSTVTCPLGDGETDVSLRPVENVSWYDAVVFCNKLSLMMGKERCYKLNNVTYPNNVIYPDDNTADIPTDANSNTISWYKMTCDWNANGYRLPTECEWECAARGGNPDDTTNWNYTHSGNMTGVWSGSYSYSHTWEVGLKGHNLLDLYDMSGNVYEWCWDYCVLAASYTTMPVTGPNNGVSDSNYSRIKRGGSWNSLEDSCKVSSRSSDNPFARSNKIGFRIAQTVTTP